MHQESAFATAILPLNVEGLEALVAHGEGLAHVKNGSLKRIELAGVPGSPVYSLVRFGGRVFAGPMLA